LQLERSGGGRPTRISVFSRPPPAARPTQDEERLQGWNPIRKERLFVGKRLIQRYGAVFAALVAGIALGALGTVAALRSESNGMSAEQAAEIVTNSSVYKERGTIIDAARSVLAGLPPGYLDCKGLDPNLVVPGERILTEHLDLLPPEQLADGWLVHCITGAYFVSERDGVVQRR
jgi:hypothetical protein